MVNLYKNKSDYRTKVFFVLDDEDRVKSAIVGNQAVSNDGGYQFYVDDYVADQIHKFDKYMVNGKLKLELLEGEELNIPSEVEEKEKEIKRLEKQLRELKGEENAE